MCALTISACTEWNAEHLTADDDSDNGSDSKVKLDANDVQPSTHGEQPVTPEARVFQTFNSSGHAAITHKLIWQKSSYRKRPGCC